MRAVRTLRSLVAVGAVATALVSTTTTASADQAISVPCNETALVNAINAANLAGGAAVQLAPFCTYTLTSAHGVGGTGGPAGLPKIVTPISLQGFGTEITRAPGAPAFRIFEVDGPSASPAGRGQLSLTTLTVRGGNAGLESGGGIANFGGTVTLNSSTVRNNAAARGGGIYTDHSLVLAASTVTGNSASIDGGGIFAASGSVSLAGSLVSANTPNNCSATAPTVPAC